MRTRQLLFLLLALPTVAFAQATPEPPKYPDFATVVKGAKIHEGLFSLHQKDDQLFAEIPPQLFDRPLLLPIAIAKGAGVGGTTLNFDEQWVITFHKQGEKVFVVRKNLRFIAKPGTPEAKALDTTYSDSIIATLPIKTVNALKASVVVDWSQLFFSDFANLNVGNIDRERTSWHKVKAFKKNVELQVAATIVGANTKNIGASGGDEVVDRRGVSVIIQYGLVELPEPGYQTRNADDRVGHFMTVRKDFSKDGADTPFVRYVNRWRLERADGSVWKEGAKLVPPKKKIVFWIENSVPGEYRSAVREGILEWNKAFEKVGFRDAIEVRQQEGEDFDPEDITYATFRWITSEVPYAIGPSRANPYTGEILDADILFDASMVRAYKGESRLFRDTAGRPVDFPSTLQASQRGLMLPNDPLDRLRANLGWNDATTGKGDQQQKATSSARYGYCQCAAHKTNELGLALLAAASVNGLAMKEGDKIPEELMIQAVKETVMHEVGHTLGLRHNFKASTMLKPDQLHDTTITSKQGIVASVMDYNPSNIAPKGTKQGHYFTPTIGAYDYWAIEYAYHPNASDADLAKIASRSGEPLLAYGTDEDLYGTLDPHVNQWDLGNEPLQFAKDRDKLSKDLIPVVVERTISGGEGYSRSRAALNTLIDQFGNSAFLASRYVGGSTYSRHHKDDANAKDPFTPINSAKQREALLFIKDEILSDSAFVIKPELLRKIGGDRWVHWGNERAEMAKEYPLVEKALGIHRSVFDELLSTSTLKAVQNSALLQSAEEKPLQLAEIFRSLSEASFADLPNKDGKVQGTAKSSVIRRNMQREYISRLSNMVLGQQGSGLLAFLGGGATNAPADAKSLARFHLKEAKTRIEAALKIEKDDTVVSHLDELKEQITKVLSSTVTGKGP